MSSESAGSETEAAWPLLDRTRKAVVVVDMVESVRLMQTDEDRVIAIWRRFVEDVSRSLLPGRVGRLVKSLGDGLLLEFEQVRDAAACAFWMHRQIARIDVGSTADQRVWLRCGIHVCDLVRDAHDIYGSGVNLTARLAALAEPGGTVVSAQARDEVVEGLDGELVDLGSCFLKHMPEPVRAFGLQPKRPRVTVPAPPPMAASHLKALVAVIPFDRGAGSGSDAEHAIGQWIAEGTIVLLSKVPGLRVVSRLSSSAFHGRTTSLAELSAHLGADYVLSGSYTVSGQVVRLTAEVADACRGEVVWAVRITSSLSDLLAPESESLSQLVAGLQQAVVQAETERSRLQAPPNLESFSLQIGSVALMHRSGREDFERARTLLSHLVERHPRVAAPRAWLAMWYVLRVTRGQVDDPSAEAALAMDQVRRARDSDPECSLALSMQGFVQTHMLRQLDRAEASLDSALALNPSDSLAWLFKGVVHSLLGQGESALGLVEEARRLSPLDPLCHYYDALAAPAALAAGQYDRAETYATRSLRVNRLHSPTWRALVIAQSELGRMEQARASLVELLTLEPTLSVKSYLSRSPAGANQTRVRYAQAMQRAGLPVN